MSQLQVELTAHGSLYLDASLAEQFFPSDSLVALVRGNELWLLPTRGPAAGGLLLKRRTARGDRSVLIWEVIPPQTPPGRRAAIWDTEHGALRVGLAEPLS